MNRINSLAEIESGKIYVYKGPEKMGSAFYVHYVQQRSQDSVSCTISTLDDEKYIFQYIVYNRNIDRLYTITSEEANLYCLGMDLKCLL